MKMEVGVGRSKSDWETCCFLAAVNLPHGGHPDTSLARYGQSILTTLTLLL